MWLGGFGRSEIVPLAILLILRLSFRKKASRVVGKILISPCSQRACIPKKKAIRRFPKRADGTSLKKSRPAVLPFWSIKVWRLANFILFRNVIRLILKLPSFKRVSQNEALLTFPTWRDESSLKIGYASHGERRKFLVIWKDWFWFCQGKLFQITYTGLRSCAKALWALFQRSNVSIQTKEAILERADFTLQLLMLVTTVKEWQMFCNFLSFQFLSAVVPAILSYMHGLSTSTQWKLWSKSAKKSVLMQSLWLKRKLNFWRD